MIIPRNVALVFLAASNLSQADVAANFTDGNTLLTPDQYPGGAGSGWIAGWVATANPAAPTASVIADAPVNSGGNYLGVSSSNDNDNAIGRRFSSGTGTSVDLALKPNDGSSVNPITVPLDKAAGTFTFQCRDQDLTDLTYSVWTSTDLKNWLKDATASITPGTADGNSLQQVAVILTGAPLTEPKLFVQVRAE